MNKNIKQNYLKKINEFKKHNKLYYENSSPLISDSEYDKLKKKVLDLENKYKYLKSNFSPSKTVGFKPSKNFAKYKHRQKMLSLSNAFDKDNIFSRCLYFAKFFDGLKPTFFDGEKLLFKYLCFFSNSNISFFNLSNSLSEIIGKLFS